MIEMTLIIIVLSFTNRLSSTSLYLSLKTSFVYSNLFSLAKTVSSCARLLARAFLHALEGDRTRLPV